MMKPLSRWLLAIGWLFVFLGLIAPLYFQYRDRAERHAVRQSDDPGSRMARDIQKGHIDKAIEEGQLALKNDPKDPGLLTSLAGASLIKAENGPAQHSEEWISQAASYAGEAAKDASKQNPLAIVSIIDSGKILEVAGDRSAKKCSYYMQAIDVLENQGPLVNEDATVTAYGKTVPLASALKEKLKTLAEVRKKLADANCDR